MNNNHANVDEYLLSIPEWQKVNLELFRLAIHEVVPGVTEQIKWDVPVFMHGKTMLFAMSAFKSHTKYNFIYNGALLADENKLFNNGFESKKSRGIDLREGKVVDVSKLKALIKSSVALAG